MQSNQYLATAIKTANSDLQYFRTLKTRITLELADVLMLRYLVDDDPSTNPQFVDNPNTPEDEAKIAKENWEAAIKAKFGKDPSQVTLAEAQTELERLIRTKIGILDPMIDSKSSEVKELRALQASESFTS